MHLAELEAARQGMRKGARRPQEASNPLPPGPPPAENTTSIAAAGVALTWKANSNSVAWPPSQVPAAPSEDTSGGRAPRTVAPARQLAQLTGWEGLSHQHAGRVREGAHTSEGGQHALLG